MTVETVNNWMIARWSSAIVLLLIPLAAMQFGADGVEWTLSDFVFAGVLIFGSLGAYEVVSKMRGGAAYRTGLAVGIGAAFLLMWVNAAVGITDGDADVMVPVVVAVGVVGALVARFRPQGMSLAMWAAALAMMLVGIVALMTGMVPEFNSAFEILGITAFFVVLFSGSALLFREAARESSDGEVKK